MTPKVTREGTPKEASPDKAKIAQKSKVVPGIIAIVAIVLVVVALIYVLLPSAAKFGDTTTTTTTETATTTTKKPPVIQDTTLTVDDTGPYKGWQIYNNKTWGVAARYPAGWTVGETAGSMSVVFLGPPTPNGGVILNECSYSIFIEDVSGAIGLPAYAAAARNTPQGAGDITNQIDTSIDSNEAIQIVDTYVDTGQPWKRSRTWIIKNNRAYTFTYKASINYEKIDYYVIHEPDAEQIESSIVIK